MLAAFVASASWQLALAAGGALLGRAVTGPRGRRVTGVVSAAGHRRPGRPYDDVVTLPDGVTLRTAVVADADAGSRLHRDCWREAYGPITDLAALEQHLADEAGWVARWQAQIEAGFAPLLAVDADGTPVGFARAGASRDEDVPRHPGAVRPLRPGGLVRHRHRPRPLRRRGRHGPGVPVGAGGQRPGPRVLPAPGLRARRRPRALRAVVRLGDQDGPPMTYLDLADPACDVTSPAVHAARERGLVGGDELRLGGAAVRRGERAAARPSVPAGQRAVAGAERPALRPVRRLVEGDPAQPRGRRPRPAAAAALPGVPQAGDRRDGPALPGGWPTSWSTGSRTAGASSSSASSRSRTPPGSSACSSGCPRTTGARSRTGPTTWASPSGSGSPTTCPRIEAALEGLHGYIDEVVADRRAHPRDDLVSTLVRAEESEGRLSGHELGVALVFLAFAGMETTRNQLGLALQTLLARPDQWRLLGERPELGSVRGRGGDAGQPDRHLGDPRGDRGRRPRWACASPPAASSRCSPTRPAPTPPRCRTRRSTSPRSDRRTSASAAACTTAWATSWRAPTWPWPCRCWPGGCRDAAPDGPGRVAAGLGQHRGGGVPDPVPAHARA